MEIRNIYEDSYGDGRLYSILMDEDEVALFSEIQKQFGAIKAANKAAKRAWLERTGAGGFLGIGKRTGDSAVRSARRKLRGELQDAGFRGTIIGDRLPKFKTLDEKINAKGVLDEGRDVHLMMRGKRKLRDGSTVFRGKGLPMRGRKLIPSEIKTSRGTIYQDPELAIRSLNTAKVK